MRDYDYEEDLDILYINNNREREKIEGSLIFGNVVIDVGFDGKVLGAEIDCASKFFNLDENQLKGLMVTKVNIMRLGNITTMGIMIATRAKEYVFQFVVPRERNNVPVIY